MRGPRDRTDSQSRQPLPPLNQFNEYRDHPERFDFVQVVSDDNLDVIRAVRKSTGEAVAEQTADALRQIDEHPECFDFVGSEERDGIQVTRTVRKLNGEIVAEQHHFSGRSDDVPAPTRRTRRGFRSAKHDVELPGFRGIRRRAVEESAAQSFTSKWRRSPVRRKHQRGENRDRARFFVERSWRKFGIAGLSPYEPFALLFDPFHPFKAAALCDVFRDVAFDVTGFSLPDRAGLSVVDLALISEYHAFTAIHCPYRALLPEDLWRETLLFDPLYGCAFYRDGGGVRNSFLVVNNYLQALKTYPPDLRARMNPALRLSEGAGRAKWLFGHNLPFRIDAPESDVPTFAVSSESDLRRLIGAIENGVNRSKFQSWYRGQTREYMTPDRYELSRMGVVPYADVRDASIVPSVYRQMDALDELNDYRGFDFNVDLWAHAAETLTELDLEKHFPLESVLGHPWDQPPSMSLTDDEEIARFSRLMEALQASHRAPETMQLQMMLILQHYGFPTPYIDITKDPEIALWFTFHQFRSDTNGCTYTPAGFADANHSQPRSWPVLYVFLLHSKFDPFLDSISILGNTEALRPVRQKCGLLGGAGNLARNYCARYVALRIYVHPALKPYGKLTAEYLFPGSEDPMLAALYGSPARVSSRFPILALAGVR